MGLTPPTGLTAVGLGPSDARVGWDAMAGVTFDVEENGVVVATGLAAAEVLRTGLTPGNPYTYRVRCRRPDFVVGTTRPSTSGKIGAGTLGAWPDKTADSQPDVTYNPSTKIFTVAPYATVEGAEFPGFVNRGVGSSLINCAVTGPATEQAVSRALVQGPTSGSGRAALINVTIDPDVPSPYQDGLLTLNLYALRCDIANVTDGLRMHSSPWGLPLNSLLEGCLVRDLVQFSPDYVSNRPVTHNDCGQAQGTTATGLTVDDLILDGCELNARHSLTKGDLPPYRDNISALMLTPNVGPIRMTFTRGWLLGGIDCVNLQATNAGGQFVLTSTRFERPGTAADGRAPSYAIAKSPTSQLALTTSDLTYIDNGAPVSVTIVAQ